LNSQNIPTRDEDYRQVRRLFIAPDGYWWAKLDFSQLELRVLAELSQDPVLIAAFRSGADIHQETADYVGVNRRVGKTLVFGLTYGASTDKVMEVLRREGIEIARPDADRISRLLSQRFQRVEQYRQEVHSSILLTAESRTRYGRRRQFHGLQRMLADSRGRLTPDLRTVLREGFNHAIQGTAWDIFALAALRIAPRLDNEHRVVNLVHDEFDFYTPQGSGLWLQETARLMESVTSWQPFEQWPLHNWSVPLQVEVTVGPNWIDQQPI
jgi:DNA polymerase-1